MNSKLIGTYIGGMLMIGAHSAMPILVIPGIVAVTGSMLISAMDLQHDEKRIWVNVGVVNKEGLVPKRIVCRRVGQNIEYVYALPSGLCYSDIAKHKEALENSFRSSLLIQKENNYVVITKVKNSYPKKCFMDFRKSVSGKCIFDIGIDMKGNLVKLNLTGTEMHSGVFGSTGTGKSVFLNIIMTQIILNSFEVRVIDLKGGVEFGMYRKYPKLSKFAIKINEALMILSETLELMEKRYAKILSAGCKSFNDYNKKHGNMQPVFLIIDEYNGLIESKEAKKMLFELLSRARAANIIIFVCTQRPSADVLPGNIKCNLKNIVSFKVETDIDSEIVTSQKGNYMASKDLKAPGEGFIKSNGSFKLFKSYYLSDEEILQQIGDKLTGRSIIESYERNIQPQQKDIESLRNLI